MPFSKSMSLRYALFVAIFVGFEYNYMPYLWSFTDIDNILFIVSLPHPSQCIVSERLINVWIRQLLAHIAAKSHVTLWFPGGGFLWVDLGVPWI